MGLDNNGNATAILGVPIKVTGLGDAQVLAYDLSLKEWVNADVSGVSVASVTNSDGTLTVSPSTGSVVASLNLGSANTWTATQTFGTIHVVTAIFEYEGTQYGLFNCSNSDTYQGITLQGTNNDATPSLFIGADADGHGALYITGISNIFPSGDKTVVGQTGSVTLAKLTTLGSNGSLTFVNGIITAYSAPT